jgi:hypothetical protein
MYDTIEDEFKRGVNDYWGGHEPDGWRDEDRRTNTPYLMGWYMASQCEVATGTLLDEYGDPLQDED